MHCGGVMSYKCTLWLLVSLLTLVELQSHLCWLKNWLTDAIRPTFSMPSDFQWCWLLGRSRKTRMVIRFRQEEAGVPSQNNNAETLYQIISQLKLKTTFIFQEERWGEEDAKMLKNTTLLRELPRITDTPLHTLIFWGMNPRASFTTCQSALLCTCNQNTCRYCRWMKHASLSCKHADHKNEHCYSSKTAGEVY